MIISMSDIICITNRNLFREDFGKRIDTIAKAHPKAVVLREKDLREEEYFLLAGKIMTICNKYNVPFVMHSFYEAAIRLVIFTHNITDNSCTLFSRFVIKIVHFAHCIKNTAMNRF